MPFVNNYARPSWMGVSEWNRASGGYQMGMNGYGQYGRPYNTKTQNYSNIGDLLSQLLGQYQQPASSSQGFQFLQQLANRGGSAGSAYERGSAGAPAFYRDQMGQSDPLGTIANTKDFAKKTYGVQSRGIDDAYANAQRQFQESSGGLNVGGANPRARGFMKSLLGARKAGDLGSMWGQSQAQETMMKQQALESTGAYRKGMADSLTQYGAGLSQAYGQDDAYSAGLGNAMMQGELGQNNAILQFMAQILGPLMQRQNFRQPGLSGNDVQAFLQNLIGGQV